MIETVEIICDYCSKESKKRKAEINRRKKQGKDKFYCSLSCASKVKCGHLIKYQDNFLKTKYTRKPDKFSNFRWYMKVIRKNNKENSIEYNVDLQYLQKLWESQKGICPFTKQQLELKTHSKNQNIVSRPYQASIDRIDNSKGYVKGNIRFVALIFNYARNVFSDEEVLDFCYKVTNSLKN
jgi:hypothetical protein